MPYKFDPGPVGMNRRQAYKIDKEFYVDMFDDETDEIWYILGEPSGFAYHSYADREEAERMADEMNKSKQHKKEMTQPTLKDFYNKVLTEEKRLSTDSVDDQIDSLLLGYQSRSVVEDQLEGTLKSLTPLLLEQLPGEEEEPPEEEEEPAMPGEEERPEDVMGSEDIETEEQAEEQVPKVDLDIYAQKVTNLADNFENLLDIKTVIINRAMNVLREKYGEDVIEEFTDILDREFGMGLEFDSNEEPARPLGGNAGPSPP